MCENWWCGEGRECRLGRDGLPNCICRKACPSPVEQVGAERHNDGKKSSWTATRSDKAVCGSDGRIYPSICELARTSCLTRLHLTVDELNEKCRHQIPSVRRKMVGNDREGRPG